MASVKTTPLISLSCTPIGAPSRWRRPSDIDVGMSADREEMEAQETSGAATPARTPDGALVGAAALRDEDGRPLGFDRAYHIHEANRTGGTRVDWHGQARRISFSDPDDGGSASGGGAGTGTGTGTGPNGGGGGVPFRICGSPWNHAGLYALLDCSTVGAYLVGRLGTTRDVTLGCEVTLSQWGFVPSGNDFRGHACYALYFIAGGCTYRVGLDEFGEWKLYTGTETPQGGWFDITFRPVAIGG